MFVALLVVGASCQKVRKVEKETNQPYFLPDAAEVLYVSNWEDGFLPDHIYNVRAKVTKIEFDEIVREQELTLHTLESKYTDNLAWLSWRPEEGTAWDPTTGLESTFVRQKGDCWTFSKYERGCIYYTSLNH